jgi:hypothetical protein
MAITLHVRPGCTLALCCRCCSYFGSGFGSVHLTLSGGAQRGLSRESKRNGFLAWYSTLVTLPAGGIARVEESYYPGGDLATTYIADLERWRIQRRVYLTRLLSNRRLQREYAELHAARKLAIESRLRAAIAAAVELERTVRVTASGRSGGRARRRSVRLRNQMLDQRRLAASLASTYYVEVVERCNRAHSVDQGLNSRSIRWEVLRRFCRGGLYYSEMPIGCEIALDWAQTDSHN